MALIKFGLVVTDARGKLGGHVFTKSRNGSTVRTKTIPSNPQTTAQQAARSRLASFSAKWRDLTVAQRDAWNAAVPQWSKTNVFGDQYNPSGKNLYVSLNINLLIVGGAPIDEPPLPTEVTAPGINNLVLDGSTPLVSFDFANPRPFEQALEVEATPSISPGITYARNKFRFIVSAPQNTTPTVDLTAEYIAKFGAVTVGQQIIIKVTPIVVGTGQRGVPETLSGIVQ